MHIHTYTIFITLYSIIKFFSSLFSRIFNITVYICVIFVLIRKKGNTFVLPDFLKSYLNYTLCTLFERRHFVHTYICLDVPFTRTFTLLTLGFQVLLDLLWEWETLIPKLTPFPQTSHLAILLHLPEFSFLLRITL